tara:strand:- start:260 stop:604 length:345 start_codon:yes stop_codon:yes gene_type:complete
MVCSDCAAKSNHSPTSYALIIEQANEIATTKDTEHACEVAERVLGTHEATSAECLATAQLAMADVLTCRGAEDRWANCGVIELAMETCVEEPIREIIRAMLHVARSLTSHIEVE